MPRRSKNKDKKQDNRIRTLEKFVYKTIENKQINWSQTNTITDLGLYSNQFIRVLPGVDDGNSMVPASEARIGNSITLMRQKFRMSLRRNSSGDSTIPQEVRVLVVESVDGNEGLDLDDVLWYWKDQAGTATGSDLESFVSGYTTKADTNKRYKIHLDKRVSLNLYTKPTQYINCDIKYGKAGKLVSFADSLAQLPNNHRITIMVLGNQSTASRQPYFTLHARSTYKDA